MRKPKVYLAGPCEAEDTWRERAAEKLDALGFEAVNPLRGEKLRLKRGSITSDVPGTLSFDRDHYDLEQVKLSGGLIIANLDTTREGRDPTATIAECEWAFLNRVPLIAITGKRCKADLKNHPWLERWSCARCTSLTKALQIIELFFTYDDREESEVEDEEDE
jgi:nucleoside 2-deoxyribosyltransferase